MEDVAPVGAALLERPLDGWLAETYRCPPPRRRRGSALESAAAAALVARGLGALLPA